MTETKPTGFADLGADELYRSAIEDFAIPVAEEDKGRKKILLAALVEGGVTWADYVSQHPEFAAEPEPEPEPVVEVVVEEVTPEVVSLPEQSVIHVATQPKVSPNDKFLIKMIRDNAIFEVRGHRFTQTNPYALVTPADAQYILSKEEGFRQAFPEELQEFYG